MTNTNANLVIAPLSSSTAANSGVAHPNEALPGAAAAAAAAAAQQQQQQQTGDIVFDDGQGDDEDEDSKPSPSQPTKNKHAGRRKIKIEYITDKTRRHITFSKRKAGIMKKASAYELSTLTGTQVLLLVVSETGLVYTFTTPKLQPLVTKPEGKNLIQACLNAQDSPVEQQSSPYVGLWNNKLCIVVILTGNPIFHPFL
ncbi:hypothetical protein BDB00DRAFT_890072 [Zychaea mexicana]|uniref:uncharacterized protein n=1 Tax=Zychaea mexicana TaxID=64656 RepID=UPI0022FDD7E5|nr:uncharacterized protein BDB00DRAFT_890072 [Zychaea mexicana]KAI9487957.1 hypothetical protein BDB00DRAFT_890072 [Zychaea mexicana]